MELAGLLHATVSPSFNLSFLPALKGEMEGHAFEINFGLAEDVSAMLLRISLFKEFDFACYVGSNAPFDLMGNFFGKRPDFKKLPHHPLGDNYAVYVPDDANSRSFVNRGAR